MNERYPHLFAPLEMPRLKLKNRIVHASMSTRMAADQRATERQIRYYANRAAGGAAAVVTEPLNVARNQTQAHKVRAWDDHAVDSLKRWAAAVEEHDCRLLAQIQDPGRGRHEKGRNPAAHGPSALADDLSWTVPRALERAEIEMMVADFAASAARLERCGFSGAELSCGHGHLFHQFLSPLSNIRTDEYGETFEGRAKFLRDAIAAIRAACSNRFVVGLKLPGDDGMPGGIGPAEAAKITMHVADPNVIDYICYTWGTHSHTLNLHLPDMHFARGTFVATTRALQPAARGIPVMAVGLITDPAEADAIVARGDAALVGLGRPLVTDPAWPKKAAAGREADIRYCVSCNTCWGTIVEAKPLLCDNNPRVAEADEVDFWPARAAARKKIVVVGAGIAGMEAAWLLAARGHDVTVFGASGEVGGKTRLHAALPGGEHLSSIYDYQQLAGKKAGLRLELGVKAGLDDVLSLAPDEVVMATGSTMTWPASLPRALVEDGAILDLRAAIAGLADLPGRQDGTAVVFDMDATEGTYCAAEWLHARFVKVLVVTPRDRIAEDMPLVARLGVGERFNRKRIEIVTFAELAGDSAWEEARVTLRNVFNGDRRDIADVALVTYATPRAPNIALKAPLAAKGLTVHVIGDAKLPRSVLAATSEGHALGNAL
jgi:hypothetical protein